MKRKFFKADLDSPEYLESKPEEVPETEANVVSSVMNDKFNSERLSYDTRHLPVLDLDFPCELLPSSTPGKFHLYMNKEVSWLNYQNVLTAMAVAGLLEPGYVAASLARKMTLVRK